MPYQVPRKIPHEICVDIPYEKCHGVPEKVPKKIPRKVSHQVHYIKKLLSPGTYISNNKSFRHQKCKLKHDDRSAKKIMATQLMATETATEDSEGLAALTVVLLGRGATMRRRLV